MPNCDGTFETTEQGMRGSEDSGNLSACASTLIHTSYSVHIQVIAEASVQRSVDQTGKHGTIRQPQARVM
jgi:hypothetical protein